MKIRPVLLLSVAMLCLAPFASAQNRVQPPALINQGLLAYAQNGLGTALQLWLQNSLLDRTTLLKGELAALKYADANYGAFESGEVMLTVALTPRVSRVYLVLYYERAPVWAWFDIYRTRHGTEVISDVYFSAKVEVILPSELRTQ
jgi:hypothetical protein